MERRSRRGTLIVSLIVIEAFVTLASPASAQTEIAQAAPVYQFEIPAEKLSQALKDFSAATSQQVVFSEDAIGDGDAPALRGSYTSSQALEVLLKDTGLVVERTSSGVLMVRKRRETGKRSGAPEHSATDSSSLGNIEEVIVTAQKRKENLQEVPISAEVVTSQLMTEQNYNNLEDLAQIVPGVHVDTGHFSNDLFIRGIGSGGQSSTFDQSVPMFEDDIYHGRSRMSDQTFFDLDRIEVLKGPQSTFFGNNAIAGALSIITKKPGDEWEGWARALYGSYGQYAVEGAAGGPISDVFGVRVAATYNGEDGWIKDVTTGQDAPRQRNLGGRITLTFKPTEDLGATLKISGSDNKTDGTTFQLVDCPPPLPFSLVPNFAASPGSGCTVAQSLGVPLGVRNNDNAALAGFGNHLSTFEDVLTIDYHVWDQVFTSVTGFYNYHFISNQNSGGYLPIFLIQVQIPERYNQVSQEFRVSSPTGGRIEYLAGAYFQRDNLNFSLDANAPALNFVASRPGLGFLTPYLPLAFQPIYTQPETVYSTFGSLTVNVTDDLKLNAGLRGSWVEKTFDGLLEYGTSTQNFGGFEPTPAFLGPIWSSITGEGPPGSVHYSRVDHAWMPSTGVEYKITPSAMTYFSYKQGFKAGGYNGVNPTFPNIAFSPEHVDAYEVGIKSKWLHNTLLLDLDAFRSDYNNLQVGVFTINPATNTGVQEIRNAATSRSQGVEFEAQWVATNELRFLANASYIDAYFVSYPTSPQTTLQRFCSADYVLPYCAPFPKPVPLVANLAGQPQSYAPSWSGSVTARYSTDLPGDYTLTAELSPYMTTSYYVQPGNDPYYRVPGYMRLDGRLSLSSSDGHWSADLIGKNLTNRVIFVNPGYIAATKQAPVSLAVQIRYTY